MSAYINTMATIVYADALAEAITNNYESIDLNLQVKIDAISKACKQATSYWKPLNDKDATRILKLFAKMQSSIVETSKTPSVFTNFVLGKIDDLVVFIKDPVRRAAIMAIYDAVFALHLYFDKELKDQTSIDQAVCAMSEWQQYLS